MQFYCTAGRGTENFVREEISQQFGQDVEVISTDGKLYFTVNNCGLDVKLKLMSLRTVERVFVQVLHENFSKLDRRGLLTLLHTRLNDKDIWEQCLSTLKHLSTCNLPSNQNPVSDIRYDTGIHVTNKQQNVECFASNTDNGNKAEQSEARNFKPGFALEKDHLVSDTDKVMSETDKVTEKGVEISNDTNAENQRFDVPKTDIVKILENSLDTGILKTGNKRKMSELDTPGYDIREKLSETGTNNAVVHSDNDRSVPETGISRNVPLLHNETKMSETGITAAVPLLQNDTKMSETGTSVKKQTLSPSIIATKDISVTNKHPHSIKRRKMEEHCFKETFRVSCRFSGYARKQLNVQRTSQQMGVLISKRLGWKIDLRHPKYEINIHLGDETITVGVPLTNIPLSKRSYIKHCGLRTPIAWIMARLLDIGPSNVVLDPMCGSATILIEALHVCKTAVYIGMDNDISQLRLAAENTVYCNQRNSCISLVHGDTKHIPLPDSSVDGVVTDAPFGQNHIVTGNLHTFYYEMLSELVRVVKPKQKIVLLTSSDNEQFVTTLCSKTLTNQNTLSPKTVTSSEGNDKQTCEDEVKNIDCKSSSQCKEEVTEINRQEVNAKCSKNSNIDFEMLQSMAQLSLLLKATHNVKLGETEGCIFVLENLKK
ncbi:uncharacterized protein LOC132721817 [Ruditapes philippinarum]|uniref:uncharacterized protein LOC132721817 n=1 Tax=Ruditapes philippinarum TaxID=129788 RepID=UPI00295B45E1|nr:uncharacterized protein LOC132721817 [Ruditapes philippinarum]